MNADDVVSKSVRQQNPISLWWTNRAMENHHVSWVNPLFLWPFSIAMLVHQRVASRHGIWPYLDNILPTYEVCIPSQGTSPGNCWVILQHAAQALEMGQRSVVLGTNNDGSSLSMVNLRFAYLFYALIIWHVKKKIWRRWKRWKRWTC